MKDRLNDDPSSELIRRIRGEFIEMPGLRLTSSQAQRLWGLGFEHCERVLQVLVDLKFLIRGSDGKFGRFTASSAESTARRMAKATLEPAASRSKQTFG
jgi:hypothetical protein